MEQYSSSDAQLPIGPKSMIAIYLLTIQTVSAFHWLHLLFMQFFLPSSFHFPVKGCRSGGCWQSNPLNEFQLVHQEIDENYSVYGSFRACSILPPLCDPQWIVFREQLAGVCSLIRKHSDLILRSVVCLQIYTLCALVSNLWFLQHPLF